MVRSHLIQVYMYLYVATLLNNLLHTFRYTCLKERNMLLTMMHDARSNKRKIDSPERMREVCVRERLPK